MKFPKNRANLYIVVRLDYGPDNIDRIVLGGFSVDTDADDYCGVCKQEWLEKTGSLKDTDFEVELTTFYG